jgi:dihydroorotase
LKPTNFLIQNARLIQQGHPLHLQNVNVYLENGIIRNLGTEEIEVGSETQRIEAEGYILSPGWVDLYSTIPDPGAEYKETLTSFQNASEAGGFTHVCVQPDEISNRKSRSDIESGVNRSSGRVTQLHFFGMVENDANPDNLNELMDMRSGGAVGFSNGKKGYQHPGLMSRALLYTKPKKSILAAFPRNRYYGQRGVVNESETTIHAGLKTDPPVGEYTEVYRQIELARYHDSPLHISMISTRESVDLVAKAKKEGVPITCDVSIMNLCFTDEAVLGYDTRYKTLPPLRTKEDQTALIEGVKTGVIDAIVSDHSPEDTESKRIEFDFAEPGSSTIQTLFAFYRKFLSDQLKVEEFIHRISLGPASVFALECGLSEGLSADLTLIDPNVKWEFNRESNYSSSQNNPLLGTELIGRPILTVRGQHYWSDL